MVQCSNSWLFLIFSHLVHYTQVCGSCLSQILSAKCKNRADWWDNIVATETAPLAGTTSTTGRAVAGNQSKPAQISSNVGLPNPCQGLHFKYGGSTFRSKSFIWCLLFSDSFYYVERISVSDDLRQSVSNAYAAKPTSVQFSNPD